MFPNVPGCRAQPESDRAESGPMGRQHCGRRVDPVPGDGAGGPSDRALRPLRLERERSPCHTGDMTRGRRWTLWIGGGAAVFLVAVAVGTLVLFRDSATPVSREEAAFGPGSTGEEWEKGDLYLYDTVGFETASALGGSRHDYPAETFLVVRPQGCGTVHRWQSLAERWEEHLVCDDGRLESITSFHRWFGIDDTSVYRCEEDARVLPAGDETSWSFSCHNGEVTSVAWHYEVVGFEMLEVGGEQVEVLHLVATEEPSGTTIGTGAHRRWVTTDPYLVVRAEVEVTNTTSTRIGGVDYSEQYTVMLSSMTPLG